MFTITNTDNKKFSLLNDTQSIYYTTNSWRYFILPTVCLTALVAKRQVNWTVSNSVMNKRDKRSQDNSQTTLEFVVGTTQMSQNQSDLTVGSGVLKQNLITFPRYTVLFIVWSNSIRETNFNLPKQGHYFTSTVEWIYFIFMFCKVLILNFSTERKLQY